MTIAVRSHLSAWLAFALLAALLIPVSDADAQRRPVRVDAGAWDERQPLAADVCTRLGTDAAEWSSVPVAPRIRWQGMEFAAMVGDDLLIEQHCQRTADGEFSGLRFVFGDEDGLAGLIGPNADSASRAIRFSFADDAALLSASRAFQWYFHRLPDALTLASLHLSENGDTDAVLDAAYIRDLDSGEDHWNGLRDGYDGEYFCFVDGRYIGTWDGGFGADSAGACLDFLTEINVPGEGRQFRDEVVSRTQLGELTAVASEPAALSSDGRHAGYTVELSDTQASVFMFDRATGVRRLISAAADGTAANNDSREPAMPVECCGPVEQVVFSSTATNLLPGYNSANRAIYLKQLDTGAVTRISAPLAGRECSSPDISAGGAVIVFRCHTLVPATASLWAWTAHDSSIAELLNLPNSEIGPPRISADGQHVVFATTHALAAGDDNGLSDVYSTATQGYLGIGKRGPQGISARGVADYLGQTTSRIDPGVRGFDLLPLGESPIEWISRPSGGGASNGLSQAPVISADGCVVAYESRASNLVADDINDAADVFIHDRCKGATTELASLGLDDDRLAGDSRAPALTPDAAYVAFQTDDPALVAAAGITAFGNAVAVRHRAGNGSTRVVQSALVAGFSFAGNTDTPVFGAYSGQLDQGGHELLMQVDGSEHARQLVVLDSPFAAESLRIFADGFE